MTIHLYFDNSRVAKPSSKVVQAMLPFIQRQWGSPLAPYGFGQMLLPEMKKIYTSLYTLLGAKPSDLFVLTSSGAEAVNQVMNAVYRQVTMSSGKNQYISVVTDEAPAIMAIEDLHKLGAIHTQVGVDENGRVTIEALQKVISPRTCLLSLSLANGLTGVVQPLKEIADFCTKKGILLHVDATHAIGKLYIPFQDLSVDYLTFDGPPLHAPKGTGGLLVRSGAACLPLIHGGGDQAGLRAGELDLPGLAGLTAALAEAVDSIDYMGLEIARLRSRFESRVAEFYPLSRPCYVATERLPHCTAMLFPGMVNEALLYRLQRQKLAASIGGGNFQQLPLLLLASGMDEGLSHSAVSFSLPRLTAVQEVDAAAAIVGKEALALSRLSEQFGLV